MKQCLAAVLAIACCYSCAAESISHERTQPGKEREKAEYYVRVYAQHYGVPLALVRSIVEQESAWHVCTVSSKGAVGLMQLMPETAKRLGVRDRCDISQNISGGVRYLAWLCRLFRNDYRLVAAAYYAGEQIVAKRGLNYHNPDVVAYVKHIRAFYTRSANGPLQNARVKGAVGSNSVIASEVRR